MNTNTINNQPAPVAVAPATPDDGLRLLDGKIVKKQHKGGGAHWEFYSQKFCASFGTHNLVHERMWANTDNIPDGAEVQALAYLPPFARADLTILDWATSPEALKRAEWSELFQKEEEFRELLRRCREEFVPQPEKMAEAEATALAAHPVKVEKVWVQNSDYRRNRGPIAESGEWTEAGWHVDKDVNIFARREAVLEIIRALRDEQGKLRAEAEGAGILIRIEELQKFLSGATVSAEDRIEEVTLDRRGQYRAPEIYGAKARRDALVVDTGAAVLDIVDLHGRSCRGFVLADKPGGTILAVADSKEKLLERAVEIDAAFGQKDFEALEKIQRELVC